MTTSWSSHVHKCPACHRRRDCADPDCDMGTLDALCGACESEMQFQFFCDRAAEAAARRDVHTDGQMEEF